MSKFGTRLIKAAREAKAIARSTADPKNYRLHVPGEIDVGLIRANSGLSQAEFASRYGIPLATLRDWEQGRRKPEGPARVLLLVIQKQPRAVTRALKEAAEERVFD